MRVFTERVYGIPPEQVVGSSRVVRYQLRSGDKPVLIKDGKIEFVDGSPAKPVGINRFIRRRPVFAFGNSDGVQVMLEWTAAGTGARFMGLVHHTDAEREWAYDRKSHVGRLEKAWDEAVRHGWTVTNIKANGKSVCVRAVRECHNAVHVYEMKQIDVILLWAATAMLIAIFVLAQPAAAQEEKQSPDKSPEASSSATIYPAPNYGGDFWSRSYLTGDWGGLRSKLADRGVQFDSNVTQIYQGVTSGGTNRTGRYSGSLDMVLKLDSQKLGLWPGGSLTAEAQVPFGNTVNPYSGGILSVNTLLSLTAPAIDEFILPHLYFRQYLSDWFAVEIGKLDTTGGGANEFAHGRGDDKFMNLAFSFNPVTITLAPYAPLGMSLLFFPHKDVDYSFGVIDSQGLPNTAGFKTLVEDPTTLFHEARVTVRPFGLTGHQLLGVAWANKPFTLLPQDRRTIIRNILFGTPLKTASNNWALYYNFDQYLYQDKQDRTRGFGIFFRAGVANPRTSPYQQFYSFGFGGKGIIPTRDQDQFGIGYYYLKFSGDIPESLRRRLSLDHEQGAELFYNVEVFPWLHVTPDLQIISPSRKTLGTLLNPGKNIQTGVVPALRVKIDF